MIRVDKGWIGLNPIPRVQKRVESGWLLRDANRGESGWPSGSKFGLGAGRAGRVHLAALISTELDSQISTELGGKYLVFESSRSVKMRGFSFLSLHAF